MRENILNPGFILAYKTVYDLQDERSVWYQVWLLIWLRQLRCNGTDRLSVITVPRTGRSCGYWCFLACLFVRFCFLFFLFFFILQGGLYIIFYQYVPPLFIRLPKEGICMGYWSPDIFVVEPGSPKPFSTTVKALLATTLVSDQL